VNNTDERDHAEEAANRAAYEDEYRAEYEAERVARVRQRLAFRIEPAGVRLHVDDTAYRILIERPRRQRDLPPLVAMIEQAAELGAIHGRCDTLAELAATLDRRKTPGHVSYDIRPDRSLTMDRDGTVTTLPVPDGLRPFYLTVQLVRALDDVFHLAGELTDEPQADTPPPTPTPPKPTGHAAGAQPALRTQPEPPGASTVAGSHA
jgi:hypothetical protein